MTAHRITAAELRDLTSGSKLEATFATQCLARGYPEPERELQFEPGRRWLLDFAWPAFRVAVEVDGGAWSSGRHTRGAGFRGDCQKLNRAALLGWFVLRGESSMVSSGELADALGELLEVRGLHR